MKQRTAARLAWGILAFIAVSAVVSITLAIAGERYDVFFVAALAIFSATGLPLIVAITTIAVEEGHMRSATAASLVGAGILSTAIFPIVGLRLRASAPKEGDALAAPEETPAVAGA